MFACFGMKASKKQKCTKSSKMSTPQAIRRFLVNQINPASSEESLNSTGLESADYEFQFRQKENEERIQKREFNEVMQRAKRASLQRKLSQRSVKNYQNSR